MANLFDVKPEFGRAMLDPVQGRIRHGMKHLRCMHPLMCMFCWICLPRSLILRCSLTTENFFPLAVAFLCCYYFLLAFLLVHNSKAFDLDWTGQLEHKERIPD